MSAALTPLLAVAAIVLCVAGAAKLRSPRGAADALGVPAIAIRAFSLVELGLGAWGLVAPTRLTAALVACVYGGFSVVALVLARRHTPCGCFGEREQPASATQSVLSALIAVSAALNAGWAPHDISWLVGQSPMLLLGLAGAAYAVVIAYTLLPAALSAWEGAAR